MATQSMKYEKIWLALIPVIGGVIIAYLNWHKPAVEPDNPMQTPPVLVRKNLSNLAGKVNEITAYNNYNDLLPLLSDGIRPLLTRDIFHAANDSMKFHLGEYIRPVDTTDSEMNGTTVYYIKSQYKKGQGITQVTFDNHDHLTSLYCKPIPNE